MRRRSGGSYGVGLPFSIAPLFWIALLVGGGFGLFWLIGALKEHADSPEAKKQTPTEQAASQKAKTRPPPRAVFNDPPKVKPALDKAAAELNQAVVQKEIARYRNDLSALSGHFSRAARARSAFDGQAAGEGSVPAVLDPGDEIVGVDDTDLRKMKPEDAAEELSRASGRISPGALVKFRVKRAGGLEDVYAYFTPGSGVASSASASGRVKISNDMTLQIQREVLSQPENVLGRTERRQIEEILGRGEASPEEYALLVRRLESDVALGQAQKQDRESFQQQLAALEKMIPSAPVLDILATKDNRRIPGAVASETETGITMQTPYGNVMIPRVEVAHLYTAAELRDEYKRRLEGSRDRPEALPQFLVWCRDWHLPVQREYVAYLMLQLNPEDRTARMAAGYYQGQGGKWILGESIASGAKPAMKKAESRGELMHELEVMGFVHHKDRWYSRAPWTAQIDTLHRAPALRWTLTGTAVIPWHAQDTPVYRLDVPSGKPKDGSAPTVRFLGPTGAQGSVSIHVECPEEFFDCQVKVPGRIVTEGKGKIEVFVTPEGGQRKLLYSIAVGQNDEPHDIGPMVRGRKRFTVTAQMVRTVDSYGGYTRLLESVPETMSTFEVRATVLKPAADIDRTWANTRP